MTSVFHRDFDAELEAEAQAEARARASIYTEEDLRAACEVAAESGRVEGRIEGAAEERAAIEARRVDALNALAPKIDRMLEDRLAHRAELEQQLLDFTLSVCERVFPEFIARHSATAAADELRRLLAMVLDSPRLRIRLSPAMRDLMGPELEALTRERLAPKQTEITADPSLAPGNVHVAWDDGVADYSYAAVCDAILDALARASEFAKTSGGTPAKAETEATKKAQ